MIEYDFRISKWYSRFKLVKRKRSKGAKKEKSQIMLCIISHQSLSREMDTSEKENLRSSLIDLKRSSLSKD